MKQNITIPDISIKTKLYLNDCKENLTGVGGLGLKGYAEKNRKT